MEKPVIIFGANRIGKAALEIFKSNDIIVYGFLDDDKSLHGSLLMEIQVLGNSTDDGFLKLIGHKCEAFVATDDNAERKSIVKLLKERRKIIPVNAIHRNASLAGSVYLEHGNFINDSVSIGTKSRIGSHNIFHAGVIIETEVSLGNFIQVGSGSIAGEGTEIGDEVFIGAGVTIVPGVKIGKKARIGAGSVVIENIKENTTVFGNPAKVVDV